MPEARNRTTPPSEPDHSRSVLDDLYSRALEAVSPELHPARAVSIAERLRAQSDVVLTRLAMIPNQRQAAIDLRRLMNIRVTGLRDTFAPGYKPEIDDD